MWAFALFKKGDIPESIKKIKKAILDDPQESNNWLIWGLIMRTVGNYKSAQLKFETAMKLDPENFTAADELLLVKRIMKLEEMIPMEKVPNMDVQKRIFEKLQGRENVIDWSQKSSENEGGYCVIF